MISFNCMTLNQDYSVSISSKGMMGRYTSVDTGSCPHNVGLGPNSAGRSNISVGSTREEM